MQARMGDRAHLALQHAGLAGADDLQHVRALALERAAVEQLRQMFAGNILTKTKGARWAWNSARRRLEIRAIIHRFIKDQAAQERRQIAGRHILAHHEAALIGALHPVVEKVAGVVMGGLALRITAKLSSKPGERCCPLPPKHVPAPA